VGILRREYALIYRTGLLNKTGPFEVTLRDELNDFADLHRSRTLRDSTGHLKSPVCWHAWQHGFNDKMNDPPGIMKCVKALKSIAGRYWAGAIDRGYQTDRSTAFLNSGDPPSDEPAVTSIESNLP
jgi:hypothetical protein